MRLLVWESKEARDSGESPSDVVRYTSDLSDVGVETDEHLLALEERCEWVNNGWFDLYAVAPNDPEGGWLNAVHHDIVEAVTQASALIDDDELWEQLGDE